MPTNYDTTDATVPVITVTPVQGPTPRAASFLDAFKSTDQTTTNTAISDSYNSTTSNVTSNSVGDSTLSIGNQGGGSTSETVALVVGAIALLGGLYLFTR